MAQQIPFIVPGLSQMDLSHENKLTMKFGELVPTFCRRLIPGDDFLIKPEFQSRFIALDAPIMHRIDLEQLWFFVPSRTVWDNFEEFIVPEGLNTPRPAVPYVVAKGYSAGEAVSYIGTLFDYFDMLKVYHNLNDPSFGLPPQRTAYEPLAAYWKIINDWFRDENLEEEFKIYKEYDGDVMTAAGYTENPEIVWNSSFIKPFRRAYHKDYFTGALPWTQKGPQSFVPFFIQTTPGASQTVSIIPAATGTYTEGQSASVGLGSGTLGTSASNFPMSSIIEVNGSTELNQLWNLVSKYAQTVAQGRLYINDVRLASAVQQIFEKCARGGSRYVEYIFSQFGVVSKDARLQRAEYIIGNSSPIQIGEVLQTSSTIDRHPLGAPAGTAFVAGQDDTVRYRATEHGLLICLSSLMYRNGYGSGQDREWRKFDVYDFYNPSLANIGEQPIYVSELGRDVNSAQQNVDLSDSIFGYAPRFEEYRVALDRVHGDFRHSLNFWHLARIFENGTIGGDNIPALNAAFIKSGNPTITSRIFPTNDTQYHNFLVQFYFDVQALRPVVKDGIPGMNVI